MSGNWRNAYAELQSYLTRNPQVQISGDVTVIPGNDQSAFYSLFDAVREALVTEKCPSMLNEANELSNNWLLVEQEVTSFLGVPEIKLPFRLKSLFRNPMLALTRPLFDLLFDLLKGRVDAGQFERDAVESVTSAAALLFREGYEKWVQLSLISLLEPDSAWRVPLEEIRDRLFPLQYMEMTGCEDLTLPQITKTDFISMGREGGQVPFVIADVAVHSKRLGRYASITGDLDEASRSTPNLSDAREWLEFRPKGQPTLGKRCWPDMVICLGSEPDEVGLVTEFSKVCRPDAIIECLERDSWYRHEGLDKVKQDYDFFMPRLGSFVVSRFTVPPEYLMELAPENAEGGDGAESRHIRVLSVGFDRSRLEPIIMAMASTI